MDQTPKPNIAVSETTIKTADGRTLQGRVFTPPEPKAAMVINPATGYPQSFYTPFAEASAAAGWRVLTYDYRGQGASRDRPVKEDPASMLDWGRYDMPAAAHLAALFPDAPLDVVGHSVGGHFLGLIAEAAPVRRAALISVGSGYWRFQTRPYRYLALSFWGLVGPAQLALYGRIRQGALWKGEDLPRDVYRQWRSWCFRRAYHRDTLEREGLLGRNGALTAPVKSWTPADDPIATQPAARFMLDQYPSAPTELDIVTPSRLKAKAIGHDGLFRRRRASGFWPEVWTWLETSEETV